jgi:AcrR family transcriptional regulator
MSRVAKDPVIRREELIDIAEELFLKNGYEETPVSDIVQKADVAQGTFYYYFRSKDEILDALVDRYLEMFATIVTEQIQKDDLTAAEKLINVFKGSSKMSLGKKQLVGYMHEEKNALLHLKAERKSYPVIAPLFAKIIEQGVKEGVFNTAYPFETAKTMMGCWDTLFDLQNFYEMTAEEKIRTVKAAFYIMERLLGAKQGSLAKPFVTMEELFEQ